MTNEQRIAIIKKQIAANDQRIQSLFANNARLKEEITRSVEENNKQIAYLREVNLALYGAIGETPKWRNNE